MEILLIPEFCHEASLPDDFTKDARKMRDIDAYKIKNPQERFDRICALVNKLFSHPEFTAWQIGLDREMTRVQGTVLPPPTLIYGGKNFSFKQYLGRECAHVDPIKLKDGEWTFIYQQQFYDDANLVLENFKKAQKAMGINVSDAPDFIEVADDLVRKCGRDTGKAFVDEIKRSINFKTRLALVLIRYPDHYGKIKKELDSRGIPSQFLLIPTVKKPITVYSNLLKQMNAKLKQDLYRLNFEKEFSDCMTVGVDVVNAGRNSIVGLAASYTQQMTQHFSRVFTQDLHRELPFEQREDRLLDDRISIIGRFIELALKNYETHNKKLPGRIVVYRDGVGGPSM